MIVNLHSIRLNVQKIQLLFKDIQLVFCCFFKDNLGFLEHLLTKQLKIQTGSGGERRGMMQQMVGDGIQSEAAAARTQLVYVGHPLCQRSCWATPMISF